LLSVRLWYLPLWAACAVTSALLAVVLIPFAVLAGDDAGDVVRVAVPILAGGIWLPSVERRRWPLAEALAPADRVAVVRAVTRGEPLAEARLAPAVIDRAAAVRRDLERAARLSWLGWAVVAVALAAAAGATVIAGSEERGAVLVLWASVLLVTAMVALVPRLSDRRERRARRAEKYAATLL
jgi:hypothetical protein